MVFLTLKLIVFKNIGQIFNFAVLSFFFVSLSLNPIME